MGDDVRDAVAETTEHFPTDTRGLPQAGRLEPVELGDGDEFDLRIAPVAKELAGSTVRMLAYNGSIPGPTLKVPQGAEVVVHVDNEGDLDATVHWHGLRLENRYDGTHQTQAPIPVGGRFTYRLQCPDPGLYWYHPHIREDYGQELGLYGNIVVVPADPDYWPPVNREVVLTLDDVLIEDGRVAPFSRSEPTHVAMGRFGNVILVGGDPELALEARRGEVVRLYLTNTANTRVFNVRLPGARMKLVGGDSGHYEREEFVDEVLLAPSERAVVDVLFDEPGQVTLEHRTPTARIRSRRSPWSMRRRTRRSRDDSRNCAPTQTWLPSVRGSARTWTAPLTRRWRSSPRWTWGCPRGQSCTPARCTRKSFATSRAAVRNAAWRCSRRPHPRRTPARCTRRS